MTTRQARVPAVDSAIADLLGGKAVVLVDDVDRDGEGGVLMASEFASADAINFMAREARGMVSVALTYQRCRALGLEPIGQGTEVRSGGVPMVSIDAAGGVTTGISAADRARVISVASDPSSGPEDIVTPGHVFPLRERPGGLWERRGRIEASLYLMRAAGLRPSAVLCEVMRDDGRMAAGEDLAEFGARTGLRLLFLSDVIEHFAAGQGVPIDRSAGATGRLVRAVMGHLANGVGVITANSETGPVATYAHAITSVSLRPPLLLACLARENETLAAIRTEGRFAVNILTAEQYEDSEYLTANRARVPVRGLAFERHQEVPFLAEALTTITCRVEAIHPAGDHEVVIGEPHALAERDADA